MFLDFDFDFDYICILQKNQDGRQLVTKHAAAYTIV